MRYANLHLIAGHGTLGWTRVCDSSRVRGIEGGDLVPTRDGS
jgi:hypothetical protein